MVYWKTVGNHLLGTQETYQPNEKSSFKARKTRVVTRHFLNLAEEKGSQILFIVHVNLRPGSGICRICVSKIRKFMLHEGFNQINHGKIQSSKK